MTEIFRGDAPVSRLRQSKNRSPGGCLGDRLRTAIDRSPEMAIPEYSSIYIISSTVFELFDVE